MGRRRRKSAGDRELDRLIRKINKTKAPSAKQERAQTARVKSHDVTADPWLVGITAKSDPVRAIAKIKRKRTPTNLRQRIQHSVRERKAREQEYVDKVEAKKAKPIRREIPMPMELTEVMAPPLPPLAKGAKPNVVSLIYAFRAFQQYSHAFTRRKLSDPVAREAYYQTMKERFRKAMTDAGFESIFDWSEF